MTAPNELNHARAMRLLRHTEKYVPILSVAPEQELFDEVRLDMPFTKSRGTIMSRLYERLTKQSRRKEPTHYMGGTIGHLTGAAYRRGVYDAYTALQDEMV